MYILGIETSCDETAAAIIKTSPKDPYVQLVSNVLATSLVLHAKTGGIIPEIAAREQLKYIIPVIDESFQKASMEPKDIDAIAVTVGPGLIGSLLVGVESAKTLAFVLKKPIIPVNHLYGHMYANFIQDGKKEAIAFPSLSLIVSGGHTDLAIIKDHGNIQWIGGTRDDAAGEAFDKIGRLLDMPYPAGPHIEKSAKRGEPKRFIFPRPMIGTDDFDFSFSGLKTAVLRETQKLKTIDKQTKYDLAAATQEAIVDVLVSKTLKAAKKFSVSSILLSGGVAANQTLQKKLRLRLTVQKHKASLFVPPNYFCTDNGAMIAAAGYYNYEPVRFDKVTANPQLYFD